MSVHPLASRYRKGLIKLLRLYWFSRGFEYSVKETDKYLRLGHRVEIKDEKFFVAIRDGNVIGSLSVIFWDGNIAELRDFFVLPAHRSQGTGRQLLNAAIKECKKKKVRKVYGLVLPPAVLFFRTRGFEQEGILKHHFKKGEHVRVMSRIF